VFVITEKLMPPDPKLTRFMSRVNLERGLLVGAGLFVIGLTCLAVAVSQWWLAGFGDLNYARTMRWVIPGATSTALGFQTILSSFFLSILGIRRR
jgi:hypothetical protein